MINRTTTSYENQFILNQFFLFSFRFNRIFQLSFVHA